MLIIKEGSQMSMLVKLNLENSKSENCILKESDVLFEFSFACLSLPKASMSSFCTICC